MAWPIRYWGRRHENKGARDRKKTDMDGYRLRENWN